MDEKTCIGELVSLGIPTEAAPTNDFIARRQAVMSFLMRSVEGGPGLVVDPECPMIRKGFNGGYHFNRIQVTGVEAKYRDVPNKNQYSHPHDALQYAALVADREVAGSTAQLGAARPALNTWRAAV